MPSVQRLEDALTGLAGERVTGSLKVGRAGTVYLSGGRVTYVESPSTPGPRDAGTPPGEPPPTEGELQLGVLGATMDAAFFVLAATGARHRFTEGERHRYGDHWYFDVPALFQECRRRRARLDQVWPHPEADSRPVLLAPRTTAQRVVLTPVQWEVLLGADGTATPLDLARRLGRPAYAVLLAVRRFGAAGLLREPPSGTPVTGVGELPKRAGRARPYADRSSAPARPPESGSSAEAMNGQVRAAEPGPRSGQGAAAQPGPEARPGTAPAPQAGTEPEAERGTGTTPGPGEATEALPGLGLGVPAVSGDSTDVSVLIRLRDALERLL
ncbi:hypothetical protein Sme01_51830 [Sphaerisporangium melleum]|uniref:Uncharacterized protein n=1 Tax=Sphaerisporangium melleum TaxID=321316 RepID=A0A917QXW4_9ACTN|nr:hypothetical protein [Sphaerisporangium melleum]GGK76062.1 hypothetical protein GCM10007964_18590 [Sphaerisporangium melleum]GII72707.1 hypothetical protein Sme01_51830 [Sphaerisporangium melleum]